MLSVVITTAKGEAHLARTLEALTRIATPCAWRLIIAHNGDDEETYRTVQSFVDRLPIRYVRETRRGKNYACNAALPHLEGELAVFTDDDVIPTRNWLTSLYAAARANPGYDIFGGRIVPLWPRQPDPWILDWVPLGLVFAVHPPHLTEGPAPAGQIWGGNMAFRTRVFKAGHRFDTTVGPNGTSDYAMGGETEFIERLERAGYRCWFVSDAIIRHTIDESQLTRQWIMRRAYRCGRGLIRLEEGRKNLDRAGMVDALFRSLRPIPRQLWRSLRHRLQRNHQLAFKADWNLAILCGQVAEARSRLRALNTTRPAVAPAPSRQLGGSPHP